MKRILMMAALAAGFSICASAQEAKSLDSYKSVRFYGIDFAPVQVVLADETAGEFIEAFSGINELFLSEADKYVEPLATRLKMKIDYVNIDYALKSVETIDATELKTNKVPGPLSEEDLVYELQDLDIEPADGLGLFIAAGELNKATEYGTFYYVFFDNKTMEVLDVWPLKGKSGGMGLRNYWARAFYRTIAEINPTKFYQAKKKVKEGISDGAQAVKEKFTGKSE
ncbi:MAG: hypothetical protein ACI3ZT_07675 [Candidatus Cryptobacteroides sp.]